MSVVLSFLLALLILVALMAMLLVGYVPTRLVGPENERLFTLLFGLGSGLILSLALYAWLED